MRFPKKKKPKGGEVRRSHVNNMRLTKASFPRGIFLSNAFKWTLKNWM